jgi:hypothetical protein
MVAEAVAIPDGVIVEQGESVVVDLTNIAEAKFENVPKGIYDFSIESVEWKKSNAQQWMFEIWSKITTVGDYANRKLPMYISFSPAALPFAKRTISLLGYPELLQAFNGAQIAQSGCLLGRAFRARVGEQDYQGEKRSNIASVVPANVPTTGVAAPAAQFA